VPRGTAPARRFADTAAIEQPGHQAMAKTPPAPKPSCASCAVDMEIGFIAEIDDGARDVNVWHPGAVHYNEGVFECVKYGGSIRVHSERLLEIDAWRCPKCGELKPLANRPRF
jgi:predicted RNA-binding Zn-ribbon protein involved in translation (DUF1610 family)